MNIIVAVDKNWNIGNNGHLLMSIPEDMRFFQSKTTGKAVIMGRKTLESLPNGKPLRKRTNIVLTRDVNFQADNVLVANSIGDLPGIINCPLDDVFVIGGGEIYRKLLPYCKKAYITRIDNEYKADTSFPNISRYDNWKLEYQSEKKSWKPSEDSDCVSYWFETYENSNVLPLTEYSER